MDSRIANEIDESVMRAVQREVAASAKKPLRAVLTQPLRRLLGEASLWYLSCCLHRRFRLPILTYHSIADCHGSDLETVSVDQFDRQMTWLREHGYRVITVSQLTEYLGNEPPGIPTVALSFDDGYLDNYLNAFPILNRNGFKATIYVATAYIGRRSFWNPPDYIGSRAMMSAENLREISNADIEIGSHSHNHYDLTKLELPIVTSEVKRSRDVIESILNRPVKGFALPHGRVNSRIHKIVVEAGYEHMVASGRFVSNATDTSPFELRRMAITRTDSLREFAKKVSGAYQWMGYWSRA
jgi:peptidoglycan/xylan/chitin deacetylase (PgdA/CDA1 family)